MLLMVTLFWGVSYWLIDVSLAEVGPFTLNALRFLVAFFIAVIFTFPKLKTVDRVTIKYSAIIGFALLFVYIGATFGVKYTSLRSVFFGHEYTTRESAVKPGAFLESGGVQHFLNVGLQNKFSDAISLKVFAGQQRGALKCVSGVCRVFPPFEGAKAELVVRY